MKLITNLIVSLLILSSCGSIPTATELVSAIEERVGDFDIPTEGIEVDDIEEVEDEEETDYGVFISSEPRHIGTFKKSQPFEIFIVSTACEQFPEVTRLSTENKQIIITTTTGSTLSVGEIFEDNTFDFNVGFPDKFGYSGDTTYCICDYDPEFYYGEQWVCGCDDGTTACTLTYLEL